MALEEFKEFKPPSFEEVTRRILDVLNSGLFIYPERNNSKYFSDDPDWLHGTASIIFNHEDFYRILNFLGSLNPSKVYDDEYYPVYVFDKKIEWYYEFNKETGKYIKKRREYYIEFEVFNSSILVKYKFKDYEEKREEED